VLRARLSCLVLVLGFGLGTAPSAGPAQTASTLTSDELFRATKVWTIHLTLPNDTFSALTPTVPPPGSPKAPPPRPAAPAEIPAVLPPDLLKLVIGGFAGPEGGRNGISGAVGIDFEYVHASLDLDDMHFRDVAVRPKGNGTYNPVRQNNIAKPALKIDLNKYVKGQKLAGVSTLNLHNSVFDPTWMNETLALRLYRDAGVPAPRTAYARVYVTAKDGEPRRNLGLYTLVENIDSNFTESRYNVKGGALYKPVTVVPFKFLTRDWADYNQMYDPKTDLTDADKKRIMDFCEFLWSAPDDEFNARLGDFLDIDAFGTYMAVLVWMANPDSLLEQGQNYYLFVHPTTNKFMFLPWDQDHSFGQFVPFRTAESQQQLDIMNPWVPRYGQMPFAAQVENKFLARTLKHEGFRKRYLSEMNRLTQTVTPPDRLSKQVDDLVPLLEPLVAQEPKDGRVISFDAAVGHGTFKRPFNPNSPDVNAIKVFLPIRQASVLAQLKALGVQ
jgi:spore coat protein CotH